MKDMNNEINKNKFFLNSNMKIVIILWHNHSPLVSFIWSELLQSSFRHVGGSSELIKNQTYQCSCSRNSVSVDNMENKHMSAFALYQTLQSDLPPPVKKPLHRVQVCVYSFTVGTFMYMTLIHVSSQRVHRHAWHFKFPSSMSGGSKEEKEENKWVCSC